MQGGRRREKEMEKKKECVTGKGEEWERVSESELSCHRTSVLSIHTRCIYI